MGLILSFLQDGQELKQNGWAVVLACDGEPCKRGGGHTALWRRGCMTAAGKFASALFLLAFLAGPGCAEEAIELSLPLACEPHKTCFVQNYVDADPSPAVQDYACGGATYDKHDGTDFRLLSAQATKDGVNVLAAAPGRVRAVRDGMEDVFFRKIKPEQIKGKECGNGVVIDHGNGWETQYCHMLKGSIAVAKGQEVKRGDKLGNVGYSGMTEFAHVHLTVRHNGSAVDPFAPDAAPGTCAKTGAAAGKTLWEPSVIAHFGYRAGEIIANGFTSAPIDFEKLEVDHTDIAAFDTQSKALIFYARFINLTAGDRVRLVVSGPGGPLVEQLSEPLERNKATYLTFAGKKRGELAWQPGRYDARAEIVREGAVTAAAVNSMELAAPAEPPAPANSR